MMNLRPSSKLVDEIERYAPDSSPPSGAHTRPDSKDKGRGKAVVERVKQDLLAIRWLNSAQAAFYMGLEPSTLAMLRREGRGPRYARLAGNGGRPSKHGRVRYARHDLDVWLRKYSYPVPPSEDAEDEAPGPNSTNTRRKERR